MAKLMLISPKPKRVRVANFLMAFIIALSYSHLLLRGGGWAGWGGWVVGGGGGWAGGRKTVLLQRLVSHKRNFWVGGNY